MAESNTNKRRRKVSDQDIDTSRTNLTSRPPNNRHVKNNENALVLGKRPDIAAKRREGIISNSIFRNNRQQNSPISTAPNPNIRRGTRAADIANVADLSTRFYRKSGGSASRKVNDKLAEYRTFKQTANLNSLRDLDNAFNSLSELSNLLTQVSAKKSKQAGDIVASIYFERQRLEALWRQRIQHALSPAGINDGSFDQYLRVDGFRDDLTEINEFKSNEIGGTELLNELLDADDGNSRREIEAAEQQVAERIWRRVADKRQQHGDIVAREFLNSIKRDPDLKRIIDESIERVGNQAVRIDNDTEAALQIAENLDTIHFGQSGIQVKQGRKLGKGGMGGTVYLATDPTTRKRYALKVEPGSSYKVRVPSDRETRNEIVHVNDLLKNFYEAEVTTTCLDYTIQGKNRYYLLELGQKPDYSQIAMGDIVSVFSDLERLQNFSNEHMKTDIAQDIGVLHLDIHDGNMMMFDDKLRLIDFGLSIIFNQNALDQYRGSDNPARSQNIGVINELSPDHSGVRNFINDWKATLSDADPRKNNIPLDIQPLQYSNLVLSVTLIRTIMTNLISDGILDRNLKLANVNTQVFGEIRARMDAIKQQAPQQAGQIELLMNWFDTVMTKIVNNEDLQPNEAVKFFGGSDIQRGRAGTF